MRLLEDFGVAALRLVFSCTAEMSFSELAGSVLRVFVSDLLCILSDFRLPSDWLGRSFSLLVMCCTLGVILVFCAGSSLAGFFETRFNSRLSGTTGLIVIGVMAEGIVVFFDWILGFNSLRTLTTWGRLGTFGTCGLIASFVGTDGFVGWGVGACLGLVCGGSSSLLSSEEKSSYTLNVLVGLGGGGGGGGGACGAALEIAGSGATGGA